MIFSRWCLRRGGSFLKSQPQAFSLMVSTCKFPQLFPLYTFLRKNNPHEIGLFWRLQMKWNEILTSHCERWNVLSTHSYLHSNWIQFKAVPEKNESYEPSEKTTFEQRENAKKVLHSNANWIHSFRECIYVISLFCNTILFIVMHL